MPEAMVPTRGGRLAACFRRTLAAALFLALLVPFPGRVLHAADMPPSFADLVSRVAPAVVNVSTRKDLGAPTPEDQQIPQFPPGSPFEEFFKDFFEREQGRE